MARPIDADGMTTGDATTRPRTTARWRRRALTLVALLVALAVVVLGGVGWVGSERALHPKPATYAWSLADYPNLKPEPVTVASPTGATLAGRFFPGRSRATIVLSHGYGDNQDQMLPWADFLNRAGFSVFTYDMRDRGASTGADVTLGALEQRDLVAVVDYLASRPDVDPDRIGALGVSLGGSTTLLAAARDPRIKAVVDDCGFSDAPNVIETAFEHFIHLPSFPFAPVTVWIAELRAGISVSDVRPMDVVDEISPRPLLIIHGTADTVVPPDNSERIFAHAKEPKALWLVPGAGHNGSRQAAGPEYERRIVDFFRQALGA